MKKYMIKTTNNVKRIIETKDLISTIRYMQEAQDIKIVGYKLIKA